MTAGVNIIKSALKISTKRGVDESASCPTYAARSNIIPAVRNECVSASVILNRPTISPITTRTHAQVELIPVTPKTTAKSTPIRNAQPPILLDDLCEAIVHLLSAKLLKGSKRALYTLRAPRTYHNTKPCSPHMKFCSDMRTCLSISH